MNNIIPPVWLLHAWLFEVVDFPLEKYHERALKSDFAVFNIVEC